MYQREYKKKLRVGLVGAGSHSYRNLLPALHHLPVELCAICNPSEERRLTTMAEYRCPGYASAEQMYRSEKLDAVIISVSPFLHPRLALEALEHGLHVFIEKPPAVRASEVEELLRRQGNRVVSVGYKKAFMPAAAKAREIVNSPKYGGLRSMLAVYPMAMPADGAGVLERREFTNWLGNGCHPLSLMLSVAGPVAAVTSLTGPQGQGAVMLEFESGVMGTLQLAAGPQPVERYQFFADRWNLSVDNTDRVSLNRGIPFEYASTFNFAPEGDDTGAVVWEPQNCLATLENKALFLQGMVQELDAFCQAALYGADPGFGSLQFALQVTRVYEAALLSQGARIPLERGEHT